MPTEQKDERLKAIQALYNEAFLELQILAQDPAHQRPDVVLVVCRRSVAADMLRTPGVQRHAMTDQSPVILPLQLSEAMTTINRLAPGMEDEVKTIPMVARPSRSVMIAVVEAQCFSAMSLQIHPPKYAGRG